MENSKFYNWDTSHDQARKTMTHYFLDGIKVIVYWERYKIAITCDNKVIDVFPLGGTYYTMDDHGEILLKISEIAHTKYFLDGLLKTKERKLKKIRYELQFMLRTSELS